MTVMTTAKLGAWVGGSWGWTRPAARSRSRQSSPRSWRGSQPRARRASGPGGGQRRRRAGAAGGHQACLPGGGPGPGHPLPALPAGGPRPRRSRYRPYLIAWSGRRVSNPRPSAQVADALPMRPTSRRCDLHNSDSDTTAPPPQHLPMRPETEQTFCQMDARRVLFSRRPEVERRVQRQQCEPAQAPSPSRARKAAGEWIGKVESSPRRWRSPETRTARAAAARAMR